MLGSYVNTGDPNSGPHACVVVGPLSISTAPYFQLLARILCLLWPHFHTVSSPCFLYSVCHSCQVRSSGEARDSLAQTKFCLQGNLLTTE